MIVHGYAGAAADGPPLGSQLKALKAAGCGRVVRENITGARADRPRLAKLLATIESGDVLIVTRLDRLARSIRDLLNIVEALAARGAAVRSLSEPWADTTSDNDVMRTILGGLAAFERDLLRVRTSRGRRRAVARGQHMGRPLALDPRQRQEVTTALAAGTATQAELARQFNVSQSTISRLADNVASMAVKPRLDAETERAARAFMRRLEGKFAVRDVIVFGSRARRTHTAESDADIAVVLKGRRGDRYKLVREMGDAAYDAMVETGIYISPLPLWESELKQPELFGNPRLIEAIKREGLRL